MRKKRILLSVLFMVLLILSISSCSGNGENDGSSNVITLSLIENISDYTVVRGDSSSETEKAEASALRKAISDAIGTNIEIKTDYSGKATYEILVGITSREESIEANKDLRYDDYVIKRDGTRIVVAAGSDEALSEACSFFKKNLINADAGTVKVPAGKGYTFKEDYKVKKLTVDGIDISEFEIYYGGKLLNENEGVLADFISGIRHDLGINAKVSSSMMDDKNYIIVDNTGLIADEYSIEVANGNIYIKGSYNTIGNAFDFFLGDYIGEKDTIALKSGESNSEIMSTGKKDIYTKDQLMSVLTNVYNDKNICIIGQQCEGGRAMIVDTIEDFEAASGQKPGIIGLDLAVYGVQLPQLEEEKWSKLVCEIVDYCAEGGILTVSAHWDNPNDPSQDVRGTLGTFTTVEELEKAYREVYTPGTAFNNVLLKELEINGKFLSALQDNGVPLIWRPLHEMNATWFWYTVTTGDKTVSAECFVDFWKYIYNYFDGEWQLDNLIWCFSPNTSSIAADAPGSTVYCYPGDEYCDIVGCDWYTWGYKEIANSENYLNLVNTSNKIGALTEYGVDGPVRAPSLTEQPSYYNTDQVMADLKYLMNEGYSFAYLLTWTPGSAASIGSLGGKAGATDFMNEDYTLGLAEVKAMFDALK